MTDTNLKIVTLGSMARRLGVTTKWLRTEAENGRLPHLKAGERFLFVPDVVAAVIAQRAAQYPTGCCNTLSSKDEKRDS